MAISDYKKFRETYKKQGYMKAVSELEPKEPEIKPPKSKPLKDILKQIEPKAPTYDFMKPPTQQEKPSKPLKDILKKIEPKAPTYDFTKTPIQNVAMQLATEKPPDIITQLTQQRQKEQQAQREAIGETPTGKYIINPMAGFGAGILKGAGIEGLARISGLPGTAEVSKTVTEEMARSPIAGALGTVAGAILPGVGATGVAGKILSPVLKTAGPITKGAATEALAGAGLGAGYAALEGEDVLKGAGMGALIGGVGAGAVLGAPKAVRAIRDIKNRDAIIDEIFETIKPTDIGRQTLEDIYEAGRREILEQLPGTPGQRLLPEPAPVTPKAPEAIPLPPPSIKPTTRPGTFRLPGETAKIKPSTLTGTLRIANKEYDNIAKEYEKAIENIQNYFGTNELRASELSRVKSELNIDLEDIVTRLEKAEQKALLPTPEVARMKRAAGLSREEQYRLLEDITRPAKTFDVTEPQQVRGFINQDKLAQKLKIEREAAKVPEPPFPQPPEQFRREVPFTAVKGELEAPKPTAEEMARIAEKPRPTKPSKPTKPTITKPQRQVAKPSETPISVAPKEKIVPTKQMEKVQLDKIVPKKSLKAVTLPGKQKISQTRLNTIARTTEFEQRTKNFLPEKEFGFEPEESAIWKENAIKKYMANKEASIDKLLSGEKFAGGEDIFEASYALKEAEKEAIRTNNYYGLLNLSKKYAEKLRENARALKAHDLAWEKEKTGANTILRAQRVIDNTAEGILKTNPKLRKAINTELKNVTNGIKQAVQEASAETVKAIKLNLQLFSQKQRDTLQKMIGKHFTTDPLRRGQIVDKLVSQFGLTGEEAKALAKRINFEFELKFNRAAENYLKRLLKTETKQDPTLEKIMKLIRAGAYDDISIANVLKEKHGLPVLTPNEANKIIKSVDELNKMDIASEDYSIQLAKVRALIEDKEIKTWVDKQRAIKNVALLWNPTTTLVNILGNVALGKLDIAVQNTIGNVTDKLISLRTGQRTAGFSDSKKLFSGAIRGARDATIDMLGGVRLRDLDGLTLRQKQALILEGLMNPVQRPIFERTSNILELKRGLAFKGKNVLEMSDKEVDRIIGKFLAAGGKLGRFVENQLYYSLNLFDKSAKRAHYEDVLNFLVKKNKGVELDKLKKQAKTIAITKVESEPLQDAAEYSRRLKKYYDESLDSLVHINNTDEIDALKRIAEHIAEERTFTDINTLSNIGRWIQALPMKFKDNPRTAQIIEFSINALAPYISTPLNIVKRGVEYSPLGLTEGFAQLGRVLAKGEPITMAKQRYIVDRISRGIAGTMLLMLGMAAYDKGLVTGKVPSSKDMREFLNQVQIYPNSLKIGDNTIDLTRLQPLSNTFLAGVNLKKSIEEGKEKGVETGVYSGFEAMLGAIGNAFEYYTELPVLQSLKRILPSSMNDKSLAEKGLDFALSVPQQYIPSLLRKTSFVSDDYERLTKDPSLLKEALINPIKRYVPEARQTLPKQIDTLGKEVKSFGGKNSFWNVFFNPIKVGKVAPTNVQAEIIRLYENTKDTGVFPNVYTRTIKLPDGKQKVLTGKEMMRYQQLMGENVNQTIEKLLSSRKYARLQDTSDITNNTKLYAIKKAIENSAVNARTKMLEELGVTTAKAEKRKRKTSLKITVPNQPK